MEVVGLVLVLVLVLVVEFYCRTSSIDAAGSTTRVSANDSLATSCAAPQPTVLQEQILRNPSSED